MKVTFLTFFLLISGSRALKDLDWTREIDLDKKVHIKWVSNDPEWLTMQVESKAKGYIAIGFSPTGGMGGADMVMAWFDSKGKPHIKDLHAIGNESPIEDKQSDYELLEAEQGRGKTIIRFKRKWNTCDYDHDYIIKEETTKIIWAYSDEKPEMSGKKFEAAYHGKLRGTRSLYVKMPSLHKSLPDDNNLPKNVKYWDVKMDNNQVDEEQTTYFCKIAKFPHLHKKHHMIGFKPLLDPNTVQYVHHMLMYQCKVPGPAGETAKIFEKHASHDGGRCYTANMPPEWNRYCQAASMIFAVGHEGEMYPDVTGFPLGEEFDGTTYFLFEIHYANEQKESFVDSTGVRIYYTDKLRKYDTETIFVGTKVSPFHVIPPGQKDFVTKGFCSKECTEMTIPKEGITVYQVFLHAHQAAREIIVRHLRNGKELEPLSHDRHFDFDYQQVKLLSKPVVLLPGDELLTECTYNTESYEYPIFGGLSTKEEMCLAFLYYYPKQALADCRTDMEFTNFFEALGIKKVTGEILKTLNMPYKPTPGQESDPPENSQLLQNSTETRLYNSFDLIDIKEPISLKGEKVGEYLRALNWDDKSMTKKVNRDWLSGDYYQFCTAQGRKRHPLHDYILKFPKYRPWIDPEMEKCDKKRGGRKTTRKPSSSGTGSNSLTFRSGQSSQSSENPSANRPAFARFMKRFFPRAYNLVAGRMGWEN